MSKIQADYKALRRQGWNTEQAREIAEINANLQKELDSAEWIPEVVQHHPKFSVLINAINQNA